MSSNQTNTTTNETSNIATMPSTPKAQTAKEVIAANVKLLIEQLEAGHSEGLTAYLTAMGRFAKADRISMAFHKMKSFASFAIRMSSSSEY